jgi:hypothetical protein
LIRDFKVGRWVDAGGIDDLRAAIFIELVEDDRIGTGKCGGSEKGD